MPAGVAPRARMPALPACDAPLSERLLHRGPEYLRRHLDAARPARRSAVERLAADRAKYVKSRPAAGAPTLGPAGPSSASESSSESCSGESRRSAPGPRGREGTPAGAPQAPCPVARRAVARRPLRPDSLVIYRQKCEFVRGPGADGSRVSLVKKFFQGSGKDKALVPPEMPRVREEVRPESREAGAPGQEAGAPGQEAGAPGQEAGAPGQETVPAMAAGNSLGPGPAAGSVPPTSPALSPPARDPSRVQAVPPGSDLWEVRRRGLLRSQSDVSSRYSKSFAECDSFFQYCGLDPEVVEDLGRENFSAGSDHVAFKVRSVSIATSDSGFSRHSGAEDGLQEDELVEQVPSTTSVIEKNARIIKWLYTCKKAKETPTLQGTSGEGVMPSGPQPGDQNPKEGILFKKGGPLDVHHG